MLHCRIRDADVVCYSDDDYSSSFSTDPCSCASTVFTACSKMNESIRESVVSAGDGCSFSACFSGAADADSGIVR